MNQPTWGDTVRIEDNASLGKHAGSLAAVCGVRKVETAEQADQFGVSIGALLYLVELSDGTSIEISGASLEVVSGLDSSGGAHP